MKKVGVLTFHRANNVGAVLQNYALTKCLARFSDVETINYVNEKIESENRVFSSKSIKATIKMILQFSAYVDRELSFNKFRSSYLPISSKKYTGKNIVESNMEYDCFVVGSDQVWNTFLTNSDYTYYLDFADRTKLKVAYAGSFGSKLHFLGDEEKKLLKEFNHISVREYEAVSELQKFGIRAENVVDPTLLLTFDEWQRLLQQNSKKQEPYILVYMVANTPKLIDAAKKYADEHGLGIKMIHYGYKKIDGVDNIRNVSPTRFLDLLYNAECVFCSSFHAVCFSLIFRKQFMYALDSNPINNNSRLTNLCESLGLMQRNIDFGKMDSPIDYSDIDQKLQVMRELSFDNLKKSILKDDVNV